MNANKFLPPPVRLSQAFEPGGFGGCGSGSEITRRSFMKRTGGATVATLVSWNLASQRVNAETGSGESLSHKMCALSPQGSAGYPDVIGSFSFAQGGWVRLTYKDQACYFDGGPHAQFAINSLITLVAEAWLPTKQGRNAQNPWILDQTPADSERNTFSFSGAAIARTNQAQMPLATYASINLNGELPPNSNLFLKLRITSIVRTATSVQVDAESWLEGNVGGINYDQTLGAVGFGISLVEENNQEPHGSSQCQCAV